VHVADQIDATTDNENRRYGPKNEYGHIVLLQIEQRGKLSKKGIVPLTNWQNAWNSTAPELFSRIEASATDDGDERQPWLETRL
jgi:hypothetical protein